jgi:hypothetical protein
MEEVTSIMESLSDNVFASEDDRRAFEQVSSAARRMSSKILTTLRPRKFRLHFSSEEQKLTARCRVSEGHLREIEVVVFQMCDFDLSGTALAQLIHEKVGYDPMIAEHSKISQRIARHIPLLANLIGDTDTLSPQGGYDFVDEDLREKNISAQSHWHAEQGEVYVLSSGFFEDLANNQVLMLRYYFDIPAINDKSLSAPAIDAVNKMNATMQSFRLVPRPGLLEDILTRF